MKTVWIAAMMGMVALPAWADVACKATLQPEDGDAVVYPLTRAQPEAMIGTLRVSVHYSEQGLRGITMMDGVTGKAVNFPAPHGTAMPADGYRLYYGSAADGGENVTVECK